MTDKETGLPTHNSLCNVHITWTASDEDPKGHAALQHGARELCDFDKD